jgi:hypothetical protein
VAKIGNSKATRSEWFLFRHAIVPDPEGQTSEKQKCNLLEEIEKPDLFFFLN